MLSLLLCAVLVSSALGARENLTIYSGPHQYVPEQYGYGYPYVPAYGYGVGVVHPQQYAYVPHVVNPGYTGSVSVPAIHSIYDRPFLLVTKVPNSQELTACVVKDGLVALPESTCARHIHQDIVSGKGKTGFLFYPRTLDVNRLYPGKNLSVVRYEIPENIRFYDFVQLQAYNMPWLLVTEPEEFEQHTRTWGLVRIGQIGATEKSVKVEKEYSPYYIPGYPYSTYYIPGYPYSTYQGDYQYQKEVTGDVPFLKTITPDVMMTMMTF